MPERPTASDITDDQLDALWDALEEIEAVHSNHCGYCAVCCTLFPCTTIKIISRQRSRALEPPCTRSAADRND